MRENAKAALNVMPFVSEVVTTDGGIRVEVLLVGVVLVVWEFVPITSPSALSFPKSYVGWVN